MITVSWQHPLSLMNQKEAKGRLDTFETLFCVPKKSSLTTLKCFEGGKGLVGHTQKRWNTTLKDGAH